MSFAEEDRFCLNAVGKDLYNRIKTPEEAFLVSRISASWTTKEEIRRENSMFSDEEFDRILGSLVSKGVLLVDIKANEQTTSPGDHRSQQLLPPVQRHYPGLEIATLFLSPKLRNLSKDAIREIVFLSQYGKNIDYYRRLGFFKNPLSRTANEINKRIQEYTDFFDTASFAVEHHESFGKHLYKAVQIFNESKRLQDVAFKEAYDARLIQSGRYTLEQKQTMYMRGKQHYDEAKHLFESGLLQQAKSEISIALSGEPDNPEYTQLKDTIQYAIKQSKIKAVLLKLEQNATILWDERVVHKILSQLFALDDSVTLKMKVARLLHRRQAYALALDVLYDISTTDLDSRLKIRKLTKEIKKDFQEHKKKF